MEPQVPIGYRIEPVLHMLGNIADDSDGDSDTEAAGNDGDEEAEALLPLLIPQVSTTNREGVRLPTATGEGVESAGPSPAPAFVAPCVTSRRPPASSRDLAHKQVATLRALVTGGPLDAREIAQAWL